jgi:hypothetical protein
MALLVLFEGLSVWGIQWISHQYLQDDPLGIRRGGLEEGNLQYILVVVTGGIWGRVLLCTEFALRIDEQSHGVIEFVAGTGHLDDRDAWSGRPGIPKDV